MIKYSGKILIYKEPRWKNGNHSGEGSWEIELNSVSITQFIEILKAFIANLENLPRDDKGRFIAKHQAEPVSRGKI